MTGRRGSGLRPQGRQAAALVVLLVLIAGVATALGWLVPTPQARSFTLFAGSMFLDDDRAPVAVDLTDGAPTVRLVEAESLVGASSAADVRLVRLATGTLVVDASSGEFNLIDAAGLAVRSGGGVRLPGRTATDRVQARAVAADDLGYIVRTSGGTTEAFLVGRATVSSSQVPGARVVPRAYASLRGASALADGDQVAAGKDLWLITGSGRDRSVTRLSLPTGRTAGQAGERLTASSLGRVPQPAALAVSGRTAGDPTAGSAGSPAPVPALGTAGGARVWAAGGERWIPWVGTVPTAIDRVVAGSGDPGGVAFLLRGREGWSLARVDTTAGVLRGPLSIPAVPASAELAPPAWAGGHWWTMERTEEGSAGRLWRIGPDGSASTVTGAPEYPLVVRDGRVAEAGGFSDATVTALGPRVLVNSRSHLRALAVFADGSRPPAVIDKSAATSLDARGQAAALVGPTPSATDESSPAPSPVAAPQAVDARLRCRTTEQVPHVPVITQARTTSRSVSLRWTYPVLDPTDCIPSTYVVRVAAEDSAAPRPPGSVTVQGQTGALVTGLFPGTRYRVQVDALLGRNATSSAAVPVTTGPEGPAAPSGLQVDAVGRDGWRVSWTTCGGRADCVPAAAWTVEPSVCDGVGLSDPPPPVTVPGDATQSRFSVVYPAGRGLLGRGLSFAVSGTGNAGDAGDTSASRCVWSWARPDPSRMTLTASIPPASSSPDATTSTTVTLDLGDDPVLAGGGVAPEVTMQLLLDGKVVASRGPSGQLSARFDGVEPGRSYTARARVAPPRHPEATETVGPVRVEQAQALWPVLGLQASFDARGDSRGELRARIEGLSSREAKGQTFDFVDAFLECANTSMPLRAQSVDPAAEVSFDVDRSRFHGDCAASVRLGQNVPGSASGPLYGPSPVSDVLRAAVRIEPPDFVGVEVADFRARWSGAREGRSLLTVAYEGSNPLVGATSGRWLFEVGDDSGATFDCGSTQEAPPTQIAVSEECVREAGGSPKVWRVRMTFDWFGGAQGPWTIPSVSGSGPATWASVCAPAAADFSATWSGSSKARRVALAYDPDDSHLDGCATWRMELLTPDGDVCGVSTSAPDSRAEVTIPVTCGASPARSGWRVRLGWTDVAGRSSATAGPVVTGDPP